MLFHHFDFDDRGAIEKFKIKLSEQTASWAFYSESYNYVVFKIIEKGLMGKYEFNCRARVILFLIRQSFELSLKYNL